MLMCQALARCSGVQPLANTPHLLLQSVALPSSVLSIVDLGVGLSFN